MQIQWPVVNTLCQGTKVFLNQKVGFEGTPKLHSSEVTTSFLQGNCGVGTGIESVNKDHSHSWVRISHGLNKLVTDLMDKESDDNEQETSETKTEVFAFASRSKAEAKLRRPSTACSSPKTVPILERIWIDIEPGPQFGQAYPEDETLFFGTEYHLEKKMERSNSGDWKMIFGTISRTLSIGLKKCG